MQELKIFNNNEFGKIRTVEIEGKIYFVGIDIAKALGYSNPSKAVIQHCKGVTKLGIPSKGGKQETNCIPEGDLYRLVTHSELPSAERFESWVFDEVLPTIRKTGGYINSTDLFINTYFSDIPEEQKNIVRTCLTSIEEKQKKINTLEKENGLLAQKTLEWADRPLINALVRAYGHSIADDYRKAWTDFKKELLYRYGINLNARKTAHLNAGGNKSKKTLDFINDDELQQSISTAVALCRDNNVEISDIIEKKAS